MGFYCENCGEQVAVNSDECPRCGVLFKAVKCPRCGFTGGAGLFRKGCPSCGYLQPSPPEGKEESRTGRTPRKFLKNPLSARTFWILGLLLMMLIPVLFFLLLRS